MFAFLGPNGAGKTTTVEILEGFRHRTAGEVSVLGEDPARAGGEWRARIGVVLQESEPEPELTVEECMALYAGYYPRSRSIGETLDLVGLADRPTMRCGQLSGGQRRRLDVALALIGDPELLFLDEPTTGFDPSARRAAWDVISGLRDLGKTIFLTTHYMEEAEYLADRIAVIAKGELVAEGTAASIGERATKASTIHFSLPRACPLVTCHQPLARSRSAVTGGTVEAKTTSPLPLVGVLAAWASEHHFDLPDLEVTRPDPRRRLPRADGEHGDDRPSPYHRAFQGRLRSPRRCTRLVRTCAALSATSRACSSRSPCRSYSLVIFASVFKQQNVAVPGGRINESVYYVPGIIAYGLIAATFSNLVAIGRPLSRGWDLQTSAGDARVGDRSHRRPRCRRWLTALVLTAVLLADRLGGLRGAHPQSNGPAFLLDVVVGAVVFSCLGFAVASVVKNADAAQPVVLGVSFCHCASSPASSSRSLSCRTGWWISARFPCSCARRRASRCVQPAHRRERGRLGSICAVLAAWGAAASCSRSDASAGCLEAGEDFQPTAGCDRAIFGGRTRRYGHRINDSGLGAGQAGVVVGVSRWVVDRLLADRTSASAGNKALPFQGR